MVSGIALTYVELQDKFSLGTVNCEKDSYSGDDIQWTASGICDEEEQCVIPNSSLLIGLTAMGGKSACPRYRGDFR